MNEMRLAALDDPTAPTHAPEPSGAQDAPPTGPAADVFAVLSGLAATGAEAPVGLVVLGDCDLVRFRAGREARVGVPPHGTPALRQLLSRVVATTTRLSIVDLGDADWWVVAGDPGLCGIAALAVAPVLQGGRVVGVVAAADMLSRPWSTDELAHLGDVARVVEHELAGRARSAVAERVVRGWDHLAVGLDGATQAVTALLRDTDAVDDPGLRGRGALVRGRVEALTEDVLRLEGLLAPGRDALADLAPTDLRWGVTGAVRAVARAVPEVRVRPRLHPSPLPVLADPVAVRSGVTALLHAVTLAPGHGEVVVSLDLLPGSADDPASSTRARLRVEAPGRVCDVAVLAGAVGRFEALVRRASTAPDAEPATLTVSPGSVTVSGRLLRASCDGDGTRIEASWGIDVG